MSNQEANAAKKEIETYISEGEYSDAANIISESKLSDSDKENYYLQVVSALYADGNYTDAKTYSVDIVSDEGKAKVAQLQADYYLAGSFQSQSEMEELTEICLSNGSISQEQADETESNYEFVLVEQLVDQSNWDAAYGKLGTALRDKGISDDVVQRWAGIIDKAIVATADAGQYDEVLRFVKLKDERCGTSKDTSDLITTTVENAIANGNESDIVDLLSYQVATYGCDDETVVDQARTVAYKVMDRNPKKGCQLLMLIKDSPYIEETSDEIVTWNAVASYIGDGKIPLRFLVDARDKETKYPDAIQTIVDRALYLLDTYQGAYTYFNGSTRRYQLINADYVYWGDDTGTFKGKCNYDVEQEALVGSSGGYLDEKDGKANVGGQNPVRISYSELPNGFADKNVLNP